MATTSIEWRMKKLGGYACPAKPRTVWKTLGRENLGQALPRKESGPKNMDIEKIGGLLFASKTEWELEERCFSTATSWQLERQ